MHAEIRVPDAGRSVERCQLDAAGGLALCIA